MSTFNEEPNRGEKKRKNSVEKEERKKKRRKQSKEIKASRKKTFYRFLLNNFSGTIAVKSKRKPGDGSLANSQKPTPNTEKNENMNESTLDETNMYEMPLNFIQQKQKRYTR